MGKTLLTIAALATATMAMPASAAIIISAGGNQAQGQTVQFNTTQNGTPVTGTTNQTNTPVIFTRTGGLSTGGVGQAVVRDLNAEILTGTTTVDLGGNAVASYIEFNLPGIPGNPPPAESISVLIEALNAAGTIVLGSTTLNLDGGGNNYFNITGTLGDTFGGFRVTLNPLSPVSGVSSLQNVRVDTNVAAAVPEPGTWAMMLLGFGAIGATMRRRRSRTIAQFA